MARGGCSPRAVLRRSSGTWKGEAVAELASPAEVFSLKESVHGADAEIRAFPPPGGSKLIEWQAFSGLEWPSFRMPFDAWWPEKVNTGAGRAEFDSWRGRYLELLAKFGRFRMAGEALPPELAPPPVPGNIPPAPKAPPPPPRAPAGTLPATSSPPAPESKGMGTAALVIGGGLLLGFALSQRGK